ncbi:MAG: hypothetical protein QGH42_11440 [Kiritimatiellia bacterium]|jgi:hypothetical protein|nr:hypothetical protein [Kiritimatiellia bacterium]MDP6631108.1 hypothetical protein [Kiritimatiellia bacterium]MDP6810065.1 hypothetical protein [Kiritimatiellia bacterium]MDP7024836.1 hypothetical protein [Kiritimatiellia bacterium]
MATKDTYQYSRGPIGVPTVVLAAAWVVIWGLWPSFEVKSGAPGRRRPSRTEVSYGVAQESLYMSPVLFARATRVGFRAPEETTEDTELLKHEGKSRRLRFLHVAPTEPDFEGMRQASLLEEASKQVDAYHPLWKDSASFAAAGERDRIVVDVRGQLRARAYRPAESEWPKEVPAQDVEIDAFVGIDATGVSEGVFLEKGSGNGVLDAGVVRALERGRGDPGSAPVSGRVKVTIRSMDEGQD